MTCLLRRSDGAFLPPSPKFPSARISARLSRRKKRLITGVGVVVQAAPWAGVCAGGNLGGVCVLSSSSVYGPILWGCGVAHLESNLLEAVVSTVTDQLLGAVARGLRLIGAEAICRGSDWATGLFFFRIGLTGVR